MRISFGRTLTAGALVIGVAACTEPTGVQELHTPMQAPADMIVAPQFSASAVVGLSSSVAATSPAFCDGSTTVTVTLDALSPPPSTIPVDVILVLDESGSINATAFGQIKQAAMTFVQHMDAADGANDGTLSGGRVGVAMFGSNARVIINLNSSENALLNSINSINQAGGATNMLAGLDLSRQMLNGGVANDAVLLMTDGVYSGTNPAALATQMKNALGITIYTIGMGSNINAAALTSLASSPDHYYQAPTGAELAGIFTEIATGVAGPAATLISYDVTVADGWTLSSAAVSPADKGTLTSSPTGLQWTAPELRTEQVVITYTLDQTGTIGGVRPVHNPALLTFKDHENVDQSVDHSGVTVQVDGCNTAPVADAGADQAIGLSGAPTADVLLDGSASTDDGQPQPLTYEWSLGATPLGSGATLSVPLGLGTHTITLTVNDGELSATDDVVITVTDPSPPVITPTVTGTLGDNDWYTSDIGVQFDVIDLESPATTTGCDAASVTTDTSGETFVCSAESAGGASSETVTVKRDATDPVVTFTGALSYTVDETVSIVCAATDNLSGIASTTCADISAAAYTFALGAHAFGASAMDNAGNTGSASGSFTVGVTTASLCALVQAWTDNPGIAHALCMKLNVAAAARNANARAGQIGAFINQVEAQSGKAIPADKAAILIALAQALL